jgi:chromate transporter
LVERTQGKQRIEIVLKLITAVVLAAILDLAVFLSRGVLFPASTFRWSTLDIYALIWSAVSFVLLRVFKMNVIGVIGLSLLLGLSRWFLLLG